MRRKDLKDVTIRQQKERDRLELGEKTLSVSYLLAAPLWLDFSYFLLLFYYYFLYLYAEMAGTLLLLKLFKSCFYQCFKNTSAFMCELLSPR